jgi:hypothetical protein
VGTRGVKVRDTSTRHGKDVWGGGVRGCRLARKGADRGRGRGGEERKREEVCETAVGGVEIERKGQQEPH